MKANLIEVNVAVLNMSSRNMADITTSKKNQTLLKFYLNLIHVETTILPKRVKTSNIPMFLKTSVVGVNFKK